MAGLLDILPLLFKTAPAVKYGMQGVDYGPQTQVLQQMQRLAGAQTNMNNPLFQNLYGQEKLAGQQNLAESIAEIERQNRLAIANGQNPLLSQERGGEEVFRNLMKGYQDVQNTARTNTFEQLGRGENALAPVYNGYDQIAKGNFTNNVLKANSYGSIGDALQSLFGLNKQNVTPQDTSKMTVYPSGESIRWNTPGWNGVGF